MCMYIDVHEMFRSITVISELRIQLHSVKVMATFQTKTYNVRVLPRTSVMVEKYFPGNHCEIDQLHGRLYK